MLFLSSYFGGGLLGLWGFDSAFAGAHRVAVLQGHTVHAFGGRAGHGSKPWFRTQNKVLAHLYDRISSEINLWIVLRSIHA